MSADGFSYDDQFANISVGELETPTQRIVRECYEELEKDNADTLAEFDPNGAEADTSIPIRTYFPEAEAAEPVLADQLQYSMLRRLGLSFSPLAEDDPSCFFQYIYRQGGIVQLRRIRRQDDSSLTVHTYVEKDGKINFIRLLSNTEAINTKLRLQESFEDFDLSAHLGALTEVDADTIHDANMKPEDRNKFIEQAGELNHIEAVVPGLPEVAKARKDLVKAMLPSLAMLGFFRKRKLTQRHEAYANALARTYPHFPADGKAAEEFFMGEQHERLTALERQLSARKRVKIMGKTAFMGQCYGHYDGFWH